MNNTSVKLLMALFFLLCIADGAFGVSVEEASSADVSGEGFAGSTIAGVAGVVALIVVLALCMGNRKINPNVKHTGPPSWTSSLAIRQELNTGFSGLSDGMKTVTSNFHVMRERMGTSITDAARWSVPFSEGKHVFEVHWPKLKNRGISSCIGVGSGDVPLKMQGRVSLVGQHSQSWGLDLAKMRSFNFGKVQQRLYLPVPDKFFMYVDMDSGSIGFGADVNSFLGNAEFYGNICNGITKIAGAPMYVMVSSCQQNEQVQVYYRGSHVPYGGFNLIGSTTPSNQYSQIVTVYTITTQHGGAPPHAGGAHYQGGPPAPAGMYSDRPPSYPAIEAPPKHKHKQRKHSSSSSSSDEEERRRKRKEKF